MIVPKDDVYQKVASLGKAKNDLTDVITVFAQHAQQINTLASALRLYFNTTGGAVLSTKLSSMDFDEQYFANLQKAVEAISVSFVINNVWLRDEVIELPGIPNSNNGATYVSPLNKTSGSNDNLYKG